MSPLWAWPPIVVKGIFDIIREINKQGVTVLLIEQNANMALRIADVGYVLETGRITPHRFRPGAAHQRGGKEGLSGHLSRRQNPTPPALPGEFLRQNFGAALLTKTVVCDTM